MSCKCEEIRILEGKKDALNEAKSCLNRYNVSTSSYKMETESTCTSIASALYHEHADRVMTGFRKKTILFSPISTSLETKIDAKIGELLSEISTMQEEDRAYHEEERKKSAKVNVSGRLLSLDK